MSPIGYYLLPLRDPVHDRQPSGVLVRRNAIVVFMCVELMLNAVNLTLVTFARLNDVRSAVRSSRSFVMVVAAAEVVVGLAIIMSIFRSRGGLPPVDDANLLKY